MRYKSLVSTIVFAGILFTSSYALAAEWWTINGNVVKWCSDTRAIYAHSGQFTPGSLERKALKAAIDKWNMAPADFSMELKYEDFDLDKINININSKSHVGFVKTTEMTGGAIGQALITTESIDLDTGCIDDVDVRFNEDYANWIFDTTEMIYPVGHGALFEGTAMHELGHLMGLMHVDDDLSVMGYDSILTFNGGVNNALAYVGYDGYRGLRHLYGLDEEGDFGFDLTVTVLKKSNTIVMLPIESGGDAAYAETTRVYPLNKYIASKDSEWADIEANVTNPDHFDKTRSYYFAGQEVTPEFTIESYGNLEDQVVDLIIVLSEDKNITKNDHVLKTLSLVAAPLEAGSLLTVDVEIPAKLIADIVGLDDLQSGEPKLIYPYIGLIFDPKDKLEEENENNNATYLPLMQADSPIHFQAAVVDPWSADPNSLASSFIQLSPLCKHTVMLEAKSDEFLLAGYGAETDVTLHLKKDGALWAVPDTLDVESVPEYGDISLVLINNVDPTAKVIAERILPFVAAPMSKITGYLPNGPTEPKQYIQGGDLLDQIPDNGSIKQQMDPETGNLYVPLHLSANPGHYPNMNTSKCNPCDAEYQILGLTSPVNDQIKYKYLKESYVGSKTFFLKPGKYTWLARTACGTGEVYEASPPERVISGPHFYVEQWECLNKKVKPVIHAAYKTSNDGLKHNVEVVDPGCDATITLDFAVEVTAYDPVTCNKKETKKITIKDVPTEMANTGNGNNVRHHGSFDFSKYVVGTPYYDMTADVQACNENTGICSDVMPLGNIVESGSCEGKLEKDPGLNIIPQWFFTGIMPINPYILPENLLKIVTLQNLIIYIDPSQEFIGFMTLYIYIPSENLWYVVDMSKDEDQEIYMKLWNIYSYIMEPFLKNWNSIFNAISQYLRVR